MRVENLHYNLNYKHTIIHLDDSSPSMKLEIKLKEKSGEDIIARAFCRFHMVSHHPHLENLLPSGEWHVPTLVLESQSLNRFSPIPS